MEITLLGNDSLRIRGKRATLVVDPPVSGPKTSGDVALLLHKGQEVNEAKIDGLRLVVDGAGEYEVGGVKISAHRQAEFITYDVRIDGLEMLVANGASFKQSKDAVKDYHIVLLHVSEAFEELSIATLTPEVAIFYGKRAKDATKEIGKDGVKPTQKYQITQEKLPAEMEVVILG